MNLKDLKYLVALADTGHFGKAAARTFVSQPTLSAQLKKLEDYLGVKLFVRSNQGVILTEPCKTFIEESKLSLFHLDRAIHSTRAVAQGADAILNFGSSPYMDPYLVSLVSSVQLPKYPKLSVRASSAFSEELSRQVITGQLDVAVVASGIPDSRLNCLQVAAHPFYVVLREQDALAQKEAVSLKDCHERVWILFGRQVHPTLYDQMTARATETGVKPREVHHVTSAEQAACLVQDRHAVAFLTHVGAWRIARKCMTMRPLAEEGFVLKTALVTRARDESRLTSQFVRSAMTKLEGESGVNHRRLRLAG